MKGHEANDKHKWSGVSKLTPELIELFRSTQEQSFEEGLEDLQRTSPRLVREVIIQADIHSHGNIQEKRAYIEGALFIVAINRFAEQYELFKAMYGHDGPSSSGVDGDEVLPPSA